MAHRGALVSLAQGAAFLLDAEMSHQQHHLQQGQGGHLETLLAFKARLSHVLEALKLYTTLPEAPDSAELYGVMIARDFVSFPSLYTFCYGYLLAVDPKALFGDQARIGQGFYGTPIKGASLFRVARYLGGAAKWAEGQLLRRYGARMAGALRDAAPAALVLGAGGIWDVPWL
mmetsp:Transcript_29863/g.74057  ORF Transcript_29863/g.74057 Transcript_29863/m.74057 type:complete len:173 (-) Transcript_29863:514-1032(-)